jgi:hypothetical protein
MTTRIGWIRERDVTKPGSCVRRAGRVLSIAGALAVLAVGCGATPDETGGAASHETVGAAREALTAGGFFANAAALEAATGVSPATGDLPDLGLVATGQGGSATVGSVTFSLVPPLLVNDALAIGGGGNGFDWYPPMPGNDIAMNFERLRVTFTTPVTALGFEFVEPNLTMPPYGGTPVDSPYLVTLFHGNSVVGTFTFDAPDDVVLFVGFTSTQAFDRAELVDTTGNDDDEYFGPFYARPEGGVTLASVVGTGTLLPAGLGTLVTIPPNPIFVGDRVALVAEGSAGTGVIGAANGTLLDLANTTTAVPGGSGTFSAFPALAVANPFGPAPPPIFGAAFIGSGGLAQQGVYFTPPNPVVPPNPIIPTDPCRLADLGTAVPGGTGTFTRFSEVGLASALQDPFMPNPPPIFGAAFLAGGASAGNGAQQGVYFTPLVPAGPVTDPHSCTPPNPIRVADLATSIPDGTGSFTEFSALRLVNRSQSPLNPQPPPIFDATFIGTGPSIGGVAQQGIYSATIASTRATPTSPLVFLPQDPTRLADLTTRAPRGAGRFTSFTALAASSSRVAFIASASQSRSGGATQHGVYFTPTDPCAPTDPCVPPNRITPPNPIRVADLRTRIPGGSGTFTGFSAVSTSGAHVAFLGTGARGQAGIYLASRPRKIVAVGDAIGGKLVTALAMGPGALDGETLAFTATFDDGSSAVLTARANAEPHESEGDSDGSEDGREREEPEE